MIELARSRRGGVERLHRTQPLLRIGPSRQFRRYRQRVTRCKASSLGGCLVATGLVNGFHVGPGRERERHGGR